MWFAVTKLGKYSRSVSIIGVGCTPFKDMYSSPETEGMSEQDLFSYASLTAMEDAGLEPRDVDFFFHGAAHPYFIGDCMTPNMQFADWLGMRLKGSAHHSEACCTGYIALEEAVSYVASGAYDFVLSGACDMSSTLPVKGKPSCFRQDFPFEVLLQDLDSVYDRSFVRALAGGAGVNADDWISLYAHEYGLSDGDVDLALNSLAHTSRRHAVLNPLAYHTQSYEELAAENGLAGAMEFLSSPFNSKMSQYLRASGIETKTDGAAALIVCPTEVARQYCEHPIEVLGIGASAQEAGKPHVERNATIEAARQVYEATGVSPDEIDLFMTNDFLISSQLTSAEACGYLPKGEGWKVVQNGGTAFDGPKPINTNGGRCHFGHAHGASGAADIYEAVKQMRGQAGATQMPNPPKTVMLRGFGGGQNVRAIILRTVE